MSTVISLPGKPYWVEARTAIKTGRVMAYQVWHFSEEAGRQKVGDFRVARKGGPEVALYLANLLRDDLNQGIE